MHSSGENLRIGRLVVLELSSGETQPIYGLYPELLQPMSNDELRVVATVTAMDSQLIKTKKAAYEFQK